MSVLVALWVSETVSSTVFVSPSAVTVTVSGRYQSDGSHVRLAGFGVTSEPVYPPTVTVTSAVGCEVSTTV